ncbi:FAD-dependent monooxygenase [Streptomyces ossamyceticus]
MLILGAGPAGLVLGNLVQDSGIDCVVLERAEPAHLRARARAGFLAAGTVGILERHGLADGLHRHGQAHSTCEFRTMDGRFRLDHSRLGRGERHTVYRSCGLSMGEPAQPHAPNGLGRTGPRRSRPRGGDTHPVRGPGPGGRLPARPGHTGTTRGDGEALNHPLVEQGPRTLTPYPVSQVARSRWPDQPRTPQAHKRTITRSS